MSAQVQPLPSLRDASGLSAESLIHSGREVIDVERDAIEALRARIDQHFVAASG